MKTVEFKSFPEHFKKEKADIKNNTVRILDLEKPADNYRYNLLTTKQTTHIKIINTHTGHSFTRRIRDVSFYTDFCIITWYEGWIPQ